jgi:tetratricopeptide (TPR) repeat protein
VKILTVLLFSSLVLAASLDDAKRLYAKGEYLKASQLAATFDSSDGYAFAARALGEHAAEQPENKQEALFSQCEKYARQAVKMNPKNADGYVEIAAAMGQLGRLRDIAFAISSGVASQVRDNLEKALELNPKHWFAMFVLGRWHAELTARGVGWLYGASGDRALQLFDSAIKLEPKQIVVRVEVAIGLLTLDKNKYLERAKRELEIAVKLEPSDYYDRQKLEQAKRELARLK